MKWLEYIEEHYLIRALEFLVALSFLTPLITSSAFYFPFITPRNFFFRIVVEVAVVVYVLLVLKNKKYLPRKNYVCILLSVFVGLLTLSSVLSGNFSAGLWSNYERMDGLVTLYHLYAFTMIVYGAFIRRINYERLLQVSLFISFVLVLIGLSQMVGVNLLLPSSGGARIAATTGNATYLAAYLTIHLFIALYFVLRRSEIHPVRLFAYLFIGLDILLIYFHFKYGIADEKIGLITQIFSSAAIWVPMVIMQGLSFSYFFAKNKDWYKKYIPGVMYGILMLLFVLLILNTQTRGAIVGIGMSVGLVTVLLFVRKDMSKRIRVQSLVLMILLVATSLFLYINRDSSFIQKSDVLRKVASISIEDRTAQTRLATWGSAYKGFIDKPVFGWGVENFDRVFNLYFPSVVYEDEGNPLWFDRPHNLLFQYLVEGGILALAAYLLMLGILVKLLLRRQRSNFIGVIFTAFIVAYVGQNLFVFDSLNSYIPFYFVLAFMMFLTTKESSDQKPPFSKMVSSGVLASTMLLMGALILAVNVPQIRANTEFVNLYDDIRGISAQNANTESIDYMFELLDASPYLGRAELIGTFSDQITSLIQSKALPNTEMMRIIRELEKRFNAELEIDRGDARFNMFIMNVYLHAATIDPNYNKEILRIAEFTVPLSPDRPQLYYMTGRTFMRMALYDEGLAEFKKAVTISPNVFAAQWNILAAHAQMGNIDLAEKSITLLKDIRPFGQEEYRRLGILFNAAGHRTQAVEKILEGASLYPDFPQFFTLLADLYAAMGENEKAREAVSRAVEIDPSLSTEAESFYKLLEQGVLKN